ncbi:MAG: AraC family transcriptional regulator [Devosia sp.]|nr:AraC family transcriptional regulator [Devosia sp.]
MRPLLEKVVLRPGGSWAMLNRRLDDGIPFQWHHHPEFELTLTLNSHGQRFIGDHIGEYDDGDLVLIGPYLPHTWASRGRLDTRHPHIALVMWFRPEWAAGLVGPYAELAGIGRLLERAQGGLRFSEGGAAAVRPLIEALFAATPAERLIGLVGVLGRLAEDRSAMPLASAAPPVPTASTDRPRIDRVLDHIHTHYDQALTVAALADVAALSASGLQRLFRRHTGTTLSAYVMRLRIGQACALLSGSTRPVAHIAADVGYPSLANFNRQFRALKGMTPRDYRRRFEAAARR